MYSDYVIYVDESGDHGLATIDPQYPVFVLSFCVFRKQDYAAIAVPSFQKLKFKYFGHDIVILHSHEIRKSTGAFKILFDQAVRQDFTSDLNAAIATAPFTLVAAVIDKNALRQKYAYPQNPYEIALKFCMERSYALLRDHNQHQAQTCVVVERRGAAEDKALELAFRRVAQGQNRWGHLPFEIVFADKRTNSTGLQIADLVSHPIGRHSLDPHQLNRAYSIIQPKLRRSPAGKIDGWGLKTFP